MRYDVDTLKIGIIADDAFVKRYIIENENFGYEDYDILNNILSKIEKINYSQEKFEVTFKNCVFPIIEFNNVKNEYEFAYLKFVNCRFQRFNINSVILPTIRLLIQQSLIYEAIVIKDSSLEMIDIDDNMDIKNIDIDNFKCKSLKLMNINTNLRISNCDSDELYCKFIYSNICLQKFTNNDKFYITSVKSYIDLNPVLCDTKEFIESIAILKNSIIEARVNGYNISSMLVHFMFDLDVYYMPFVDKVGIYSGSTRRIIAYYTLDNFVNMVENEYKYSYEEYEANYKDNPEKYREVYGDDTKMAEQHRDYKDYTSLAALFKNCRDKYLECTSHKGKAELDKEEEV